MEPTSLIYLPDGTLLDPAAVAAIPPVRADDNFVGYRLLGDPTLWVVEAETHEHALELRAYMVACKELATPARAAHIDGDLHLPMTASRYRAQAERLALALINADGTLTSEAKRMSESWGTDPSTAAAVIARSRLTNPDGTLTSSGRYAPPEAFSKVKIPAIFSAREAIAETDLSPSMSSAEAIRALWARRSTSSREALVKAYSDLRAAAEKAIEQSDNDGGSASDAIQDMLLTLRGALEGSSLASSDPSLEDGLRP